VLKNNKNSIKIVYIENIGYFRTKTWYISDIYQWYILAIYINDVYRWYISSQSWKESHQHRSETEISDITLSL